MIRIFNSAYPGAETKLSLNSPRNTRSTPTVFMSPGSPWAALGPSAPSRIVPISSPQPCRFAEEAMPKQLPGWPRFPSGFSMAMPTRSFLWPAPASWQRLSKTLAPRSSSPSIRALATIPGPRLIAVRKPGSGFSPKRKTKPACECASRHARAASHGSNKSYWDLPTATHPRLHPFQYFPSGRKPCECCRSRPLPPA